MKQLLVAIIIMVIAIFVGLAIHKDPGYVMVAYHNWTIETSFWIAVILIIAVFILAYLTFQLIGSTFRMKYKVKNWTDGKRIEKAKKLTGEGLRQLAEGHWQNAEKYLTKSADQAQSPMMNYLGAARAAQAQSAFGRRDEYLRKANQSTQGSEVAVGLTQASLQISSRQWQEALTTLKHLQALSPKHPYVLNLLANVYMEMQDWQSLLAMLPNLRRYKALPNDAIDDLEVQAHMIEIKEVAGDSPNVALLKKKWEKLPKLFRYDPDIIDVYTKSLLARKHDSEALPLIEASLKKSWDKDLLDTYGKLKTDRVVKQMSVAQKWLKDHPKDPYLLLCLGRLAKQQKLWAQAKEYFDASIAVFPQAETYQELGEVLEKLDESDAALSCYRKGLALSQSQSKDLTSK